MPDHTILRTFFGTESSLAEDAQTSNRLVDHDSTWSSAGASRRAMAPYKSTMGHSLELLIAAYGWIIRDYKWLPVQSAK